MSAIANYIDPFQDHSHSDNQNTLFAVTSRFKPFTTFFKTYNIMWLNSMFSFVFLSDLEEF